VTATLWRACGFDLSMTLWGYDLAGDAAEVGALAVEDPDLVRWDRDRGYLDTVIRFIGGEATPAPEWWCLPFVVDAVCSGRPEAGR